jgi:hypothetical protein
MNKVAVIIADSYGDFFQTIKNFNEDYVWKSLESQEIDVFYMIGQKPNASYEKFASHREKMRFTWLAKIYEALDLFLLIRRNFFPPEVKIRGNTIEIDIVESLRTLGIKNITSIGALRSMGYNIIVKTTLSSVVNPHAFLNMVRNVGQESMFYGGPLVVYKSQTFVSGSFLVMNAKTADFLIKRRWCWNNGRLDDIAVYKLLRRNVKKTAVSSLNISSCEEIEKVDEKTLVETVHFRCKSGDLERKDLKIMKELIVRIKSNEVNLKRGSK